MHFFFLSRRIWFQHFLIGIRSDHMSWWKQRFLNRRLFFSSTRRFADKFYLFIYFSPRESSAGCGLGVCLKCALMTRINLSYLVGWVPWIPRGKCRPSCTPGAPPLLQCPARPYNKSVESENRRESLFNWRSRWNFAFLDPFHTFIMAVNHGLIFLTKQAV